MLEKIMDLHILLMHGSLGRPWSSGNACDTSYLPKTVRKNTGIKTNLKEKWLNLWKTRDRLLNRMNRMVWYPSLLSTALLGVAFWFFNRNQEGLSLGYLYVGAIIPAALLLLRQALDFTYKEELLMNTLADYVEQVRTWVEEIPAPAKVDEAEKEEIVEHIAESIRQTAAAGSHFSRMLTPEEQEIMREIIREFMN